MRNSQEVAIAIKSLAKSKNIPIGKMLLDCNLSKNTLSTMQSGGYLPRTETLAKIADYLDCSVDYLLGRTQEPNVKYSNINLSNIVNSNNGDNSPLTVNKETELDEMSSNLLKSFKKLSFEDKLDILNDIIAKLKGK